MIMVFSVISAGIFGAYLIAGGSFGNSGFGINFKKNEAAEIGIAQNQFNLMSNSVGDNNFGLYEQYQPKSIVRPGNFTDLVAASAFKGIKNFDVSDDEAAKNFNVNSVENQKIINETLENVDVFKSKIQPADFSFKTSPDNSKTARTTYLRNLLSIFEQTIKDKSLLISSAQQVIDDINDDCFIKSGNSLSVKRAEVFKSVFDQYLVLKVPSQWFDFHKKLLGYYQNAYVIFEAISNCSEDPIGGYVMAERLPLLIKDSVVIKEMLSKKYSEVGITSF